jgi:hypothetical protein
MDQKYLEQNGVCAYCGQDLLATDKVELAHRVPQRKYLLKKYGKEIIHHPLNMKLTHAGNCNAGVQLMPESLPAKRLIEKIREAIEDD